MGKVCCFTGHRQIPKNEIEKITNRTKTAMYELYQNGVDTFIAGGALGFDTLAALIVLKMKIKFPEVKLILALPCKDQTKFWKENDIEIYESIKKQADQVICLSEEYTKDCMLERNGYMVDQSDYVIAYCKRQYGGSAYTVKYAKKHGKPVLYVS